MTITQYGIHIGFLFIRYYGILIMIGMIAGTLLAASEARRRGRDPEMAWDILIWILIPGVIGARLYHIFTPPPSMVAVGLTTQYYLTHPLDAIAIWRGGLGLPGALLGGILGMYIFSRRKAQPLAAWLDIAVPGAALGQAIGRWGNYFNQELYGAPTDLPWGIFISPENRLPEFSQFTHYHPTFLYESIWNLVNMALLLWLGRRMADRLKPGELTLFYLSFYAVGRFALEFLRLDSSQLVGVNANQTLMLIVLVGCGLAFGWSRLRKTQSLPGEPPSHSQE